ARRDAGIRARSAGVVLLGLRPGARLGQAAVRVRGRDQLQPAARRLVEHGDLDRRAAGVERADHADQALVPDIGVRVRTALGRIPLRELSRRVVAGLECDLELPGLPVLLLQDVRDRLVHLDGLLARTADERQVGSDQVVRFAVALVLQRVARGSGQGGYVP